MFQEFFFEKANGANFLSVGRPTFKIFPRLWRTICLEVFEAAKRITF